MSRGRRSDIEAPPDAELVEAVLRGRTENFAVLVERHQDALFRHALSLGIDSDNAADMVQDTMIRAWERLDECRDSAHLRVWLNRILRNRCLDHLKSAPIRRTRSLQTLPGHEDEMLDDGGVLPDRQADRSALASVLDDVLGTLPSEQSEAFVLKYVEGYSYDEMVEITGASVSALKMRVHRARDLIRSQMEARGIEPM